MTDKITTYNIYLREPFTTVEANSIDDAIKVFMEKTASQDVPYELRVAWVCGGEHHVVIENVSAEHQERLTE